MRPTLSLVVGSLNRVKTESERVWAVPNRSKNRFLKLNKLPEPRSRHRADQAVGAKGVFAPDADMWRNRSDRVCRLRLGQGAGHRAGQTLVGGSGLRWVTGFWLQVGWVISVTIQIFHFCLLSLRFYFYFYKWQDIILCIYCRRKRCNFQQGSYYLNENGNDSSFSNKIKSNKNKINN